MRRELDRLTKRPYKLTYRRPELSRWMLMRLPAFTTKVSLRPDGHLHYPSGASQQVNFKVLLNFHTEYILDQAGHFLNEVDPVEVSENGIVNGASFNYGLAKGRTHKDLDIDPVKAWDPAFRKQVLYQPRCSLSSSEE